MKRRQGGTERWTKEEKRNERQEEREWREYVEEKRES